jgi:biopolymer transport protein ExbB
MGHAAGVAGSGMESRLLALLLYLGSQWVLYLLIILSIISVAVAIERLRHFLHHRDDVPLLTRDLDGLLRTGDFAAAKSRLMASPSHAAMIAVRGLEARDRGVAAVEEVLQGATQTERLEMERGLAFLGTLGNNAPFVGLFGTVLGIIRAFRDLSLNTSQGSSAVMAGIAEALVATAVGLLVALPAVAVFNSFQRAIRRQLAGSETLNRVLLAHLKSRS